MRWFDLTAKQAKNICKFYKIPYPVPRPFYSLGNGLYLTDTNQLYTEDWEGKNIPVWLEVSEPTKGGRYSVKEIPSKYLVALAERDITERDITERANRRKS